MKKLTLISTVIAFFLITGISNAQNVAISDVAHTADASAVLDVYSTSLGMLVPRMNVAPSTPANGLLYYNTGSNSFLYNAGSSGTPSWTELSYGSLWTRSGTDTYLSNPGDNVSIGTTTTGLGLKFYVSGASPQISRFDGKVEFFDIDASAGGHPCAEIDNTGASNNGVFNLFDGAGVNRIHLNSAGNSLFNGGAVCIGGLAPTSLLHIVDNNGFGAPQLLLDNISGAANTAIGYKFGGTNYSQGIEPLSTNFVLANTSSIGTPVHGDGTSLISAFPSGIIDMNNQSRARAYQSQNPSLPMGMGQVIPFSVWTPVDFEITNYDEQLEFTLHPMGTPYSPGGGPAAAYFTATEEGYYQVNARTNFLLWDLETLEEIHFPAYPGFVSIGIVVTDITGLTTMYAQGNKLQGSDNNGFGQWNDLQNNLAPNVSDVVYLKKGETVEIWVWQDLWTVGLPLEVGPRGDPGMNIPMQSQTYVSVHKSS